MLKFSLNLPTRRRLDLRVVVKRRKSLNEKPLIPSLGEIRRVKDGNKVSWFFRHVFEHKRIKKILGTNLALAVIAASLMPSSLNLSAQEPDNVIVSEENTPLTTEIVIRYPVANVNISQGYTMFHPGIDLDGITGEPVYPIMNGVVVDTNYSKYAYGYAVLVGHEDSLTSLYAHLSKIYVAKGEKVTTNSIIGEIGTTGRAFGDHLHLETRNHNYPISPFLILPR